MKAPTKPFSSTTFTSPAPTLLSLGLLGFSSELSIALYIMAGECSDGNGNLLCDFGFCVTKDHTCQLHCIVSIHIFPMDFYMMHVPLRGSSHILAHPDFLVCLVIRLTNKYFLYANYALL